MTLVLITLVVLLIWVHLTGLALLSLKVVSDYAVARVAGILAVITGLFWVEHFVGLGARPPILILTVPLSVWLIWRHRAVLKAQWPVEAMFGVGFFYCLLWRCVFPNIDMEAERIPDLVFIQNYLTGVRLPAPDRWLPPYDASFYYGFQHYAAALMGRCLGIDGGLTYQFAYCTLVGLITCAVGSTARALCAWKPAPWLMIAALLVGGNGVSITMPVLVNTPWEIFQSSRFLGFHVGDQEWNALGRALGWTFNPGPNELALEFPMDAFSYLIYNGEYHPPLFGFLLLSFGVLLVARLEGDAPPRARAWYFAMLAATVPLSLVGNVWIAPLQLLLVAGTFGYRAWRSDKGWLLPCLCGGLIAAGLCAPHLIAFVTQPIAHQSALKFTAWTERTPFGQWVLMFWPALGVIVLGIWSARRPPFALFLTVVWAGLLFFADAVYNDDVLGGSWNRYNSTLKWWPWIYAGIILTIGSNNLDSASRFCRWGTTCLLLVISLFGYQLAQQFSKKDTSSAFKLSGHHWLSSDSTNYNLIRTLAARPDGVALESGARRENSEHNLISVFAGKICYLGWIAHERVFWRDALPEIDWRAQEVDAFYANQMDDPASWLIRRNIRYVLWLQRDNIGDNHHFPLIRDKIAATYEWRNLLGDEKTWAIGFWERKTAP